jgi:hypothetical protein
MLTKHFSFYFEKVASNYLGEEQTDPPRANVPGFLVPVVILELGTIHLPCFYPVEMDRHSLLSVVVRFSCLVVV